MENKTSFEMRLNNTLFLCRLDGKVYNIKESKMLVLQLIAGVTPGQQGLLMNMEMMIVCESCYKENSDDKGLKLKEPSQIVAAPPGALQQIKRGVKN